MHEAYKTFFYLFNDRTIIHVFRRHGASKVLQIRR